MKQKMNPEVKAKWMEALRSGNYKHGRMKLKDSYNGGYCCLGVLCDIYEKETGKGTWSDDAHLASVFTADGVQSSLYSPQAVLNWAGLDRIDSKTLATINDDATSFDNVAKVIEESL